MSSCTDGVLKEYHYAIYKVYQPTTCKNAYRLLTPAVGGMLYGIDSMHVHWTVI